MIQFGLGLFLLTHDPSILGGAHQKEGAHLPTALQKGKHVGIAISHVDPHLARRRRPHLLHRSDPHLAFPWSLCSLVAALFAPIGFARSRLARQTSASSGIAQLGGSKRFLSPGQRIGQGASIHRFLLCSLFLLLFLPRDSGPASTSPLVLLPLLPVVLGNCQDDRKGSSLL